MRSLTLRMPDELHEMIAGSAKDRGLSLNAMVCELLARGMTEHGLRRSVIEAVRQEMRAEFEARKTAPEHGTLCMFKVKREPNVNTSADYLRMLAKVSNS